MGVINITAICFTVYQRGSGPPCGPVRVAYPHTEPSGSRLLSPGAA